MRRVLLVLVLAVALAGCSARANRDDFFGYMKKPLFASGFNLEDARYAPQSQQFFVEDGSIGKIQIQIWVNATAGSGTVHVYDPHGSEIQQTSQSTTLTLPLELGAWKITVTGTPDAAGRADVLVTRA